MKAPLVLLGLAVGLALMLVFFGAGLPANQATAAVTTPDAADAATGALVLSTCTGCHGIETLQQHPQSAAGWGQTLDAMQQLGAQVNPSQRDAIVTYLAQHFGPQ